MNTSRLIRGLFALGMLCGMALCVPGGFAQEASATTTADPGVPLDELKIMLRPLTQEQLTIEADAWFALLQEKVAEISQAELAAKRKTRAIQEARTAATELERAAETAPADDAGETAPVPTTQEVAAAKEEADGHAEQKATLLETVNELREERVALTDRLNAVLAESKLKGGEIASYEQYVNAVAGITVDVTDTAAAWTAVTGWLTSREGGIRWGINIVWFVATLIVFWIFSRVAGNAMRRAMRLMKNASDLLRDFAVNITRRIVMFAGLLVAITMLEVEVAPLLAIIGGAAFVVAFALQGTLSNFASGIMILAYRPFDVGDVVNAGGVSGMVDSMNLVSTQIKTFDNQRVIVPNNSIWGDVITNVTGLPTRRVDMVFGIAYSDDADKATRIMGEVLKAHPLVLAEPAPTIKLHELADSSVNFICRPWVKTADYWTVYWDVMRTMKERFDAEGLNIPFPQRDVHVYQAG